MCFPLSTLYWYSNPPPNLTFSLKKDENEQLRAALKSLQSLTKTLVPLVPEASDAISQDNIDNLSKPLPCTSKSGIAFLNEQLQCIITAREKSFEETGAPLSARRSLQMSLSKGSLAQCESPLATEIVVEDTSEGNTAKKRSSSQNLGDEHQK